MKLDAAQLTEKESMNMLTKMKKCLLINTFAEGSTYSVTLKNQSYKINLGLFFNLFR